MNEHLPRQDMTGESLSVGDIAYLNVMSGKSETLGPLADQLEGRCALAAARCVGIKLGKHKTGLPDPVDVGQELLAFDSRDSDVPSLGVLHIAAEYVSGRKRTSNKIARGAVVTADAISVIPEALLGFVANAADKRLNFKTGSVLRGGANLMAGMGMLTMDAVEKGHNAIVGNASTLVRRLYDQHSNNDTHIAPWLWATLVARLANIDDAPSPVMDYAVSKFMDTYKGINQHPPKPLLKLRRALGNGRAVIDAVGIFADQVWDDREADERRLAEHFAPKEPTRPRGEQLALLRRYSNDYDATVQDKVLSTGDLLARGLKGVRQKEPGALNDVALAWAALVERATLLSDGRKFQQDLRPWQRRTTDILRNEDLSYWNTWIENGLAPVGVIRLLLDYIHPDYNDWAVVHAEPRTIQAINKAAFDWFNITQVGDTNREANKITREAYLQARLSLAGVTNPRLEQLRHRRLARVTAPNRHAELGLQIDVANYLAIARAQAGIKTKVATLYA